MTSVSTGAFRSVHLLVVHGVGRHDRLSNLLRTYQTLRANLTSVEAPVPGEDQIPGWRLDDFDEGALPPFLKLQPRVDPQPGGVGSVFLYEVNYSGFAGVVRRNHPVDLTNLFLGLDLAVCASRQRPTSRATSVFGGDTADLGNCLQQVSSVLTAGTVPVVGLPSIVFRDYIGTFVATFARFFEDVATFALDKNGEQLIATHLDRMVASIASKMAPGDRLVIAAHSLGSVVVHNFVVRQWTKVGGKVPDTVITFGSPIGLLEWAWLFLDFQDMDFAKQISGGDNYFCWNPVSHGTMPRKRLAWINIVNCLDPIATAFPEAALDLSSDAPSMARALKGERIAHRFFGHTRLGSLGSAHTEYFNDKGGFLAIVLRAAGLAPGNPEDIAGVRTAGAHWRLTQTLLRRAQWGALAAALLVIAGYCGIVAYRFGEIRTMFVIAAFAWPGLTIGVLAFCQRLMLGGPTKRVSTALITELKWAELSSFPYRLRESIRGLVGRSRDIDPMAASPGYMVRLLLNAVSFIPSIVAMLLPVAAAAWLTGYWPDAATLRSRVWSLETLAAVALFMLYVVCCAVHELIRAWRRVLRILTCLLIPLAFAAPIASFQATAGKLPPRLEGFLANSATLTLEERRQLIGGAPVAKMLPADVTKEVAVFGAIWINVPMRRYVEAVNDIESWEHGGGFKLTRRISNPPRLEDFAELRLPEEDLRDLRRCQVGSCKLKLSEEALQRFRADVNWNAPNAHAAANAVMQRLALAYVTGYLEGGNERLAVYRDRLHPTLVAGEFRTMIDEMPELGAYMPGLRRYLLEYPRTTLPGATSFLYWQETSFGLKPTIRISHLTIREGTDDTVVASKMLYASHYFLAGVELRALLPDPARGVGFWLVSVSRSRSDGLGGFMGLFVRSRVRSEVQRTMITSLRSTKQRLER